MNHLYVKGVPCNLAIEQAKANWTEKHVQCSAMLRPGGSPGKAYQVYYSCEAEANGRYKEWIETQRQCLQLDSQTRAWKYSTKHSVLGGAKQSLREGVTGGPGIAKLYRRFETFNAVHSVTDGIITFMRMPEDASPASRYRQAATFFTSFGDLAIPGVIPSLMASLSFAGIREIAFDASSQFDQIMRLSDDLGRIDAIVFPAAGGAYWPGPSQMSGELTELVMFAERMAAAGLSDSNSAIAWATELQRAVFNSRAQAAAEARQQAEVAEEQRRQAAQEARQRAAARDYERRRAIREELDEEEREIQRQVHMRNAYQAPAAPILPMPTFVVPMPTQRNPGYSAPPSPRPNAGRAGSTSDKELVGNGR